MPRTKKPAEPTGPPAPVNGPAPDEVLTLAEAAAYLRLPETEVVNLVHSQGLPGRFAGKEWRFLKAAIQAWLSQPGFVPRDFWEASVGIFKDDPHLEEIVKEAHRQRGRPITEAE